MSEPKRGRVIITDGRSVMSLTAAHSLFFKDIEVIGCDELDWTILRFSRYTKEYFVHPSPDKDREAFLQAMYEKILEYKPDDGRPYVLMPIHRMTGIIAEHRDIFAPHIQIATPAHSAMSQIYPKHRLAETAQKLGVRVPKTWCFPDLKALDRFARRTSFPKLLKPVDATGGRGICKVHSTEDLKQKAEAVFAEFKEMPLVQELVTGDDYCFSGLFDRGKLCTSMAYTNIYNFPAESGAGVFRETIDDAPFRDEAERLMKALKWHGVAEIDFMWNGSRRKKPYLIEVNTRFWGGLFQSVESGIDFPWLLYQLTTEGRLTEKPEPVLGTQTKIPFLWLVSALQDYKWEDPSLQEAVAAARQREKDPTFWDRIQTKAQGIWGTVKQATNIGELRKLMKSGEMARNEPFYADDPMAILGVAFVLNSLIREGKLPPEVKF
ncbi:MAG: ATP-grasp domain-containing protein [Verrucomicrobiae bacterium]|nr:ATP-grasp domain-containing protein [Verrucomicrobiae bacterium]